MAHLSNYYGFFFPIIITCLWTLTEFNDALHFVISMSLKLKKENEVMFSFYHLIEDYLSVIDELALLVSNIKKELCGKLDSLLSFFF
jgi:dimeric dUTPase (all-alpha-NTP-PPase superfamily)